MKFIVPLMILTSCLLIECILQWKVVKTITNYGQNVTLFCNVSNCCPKFAGWDKYTPAQRTIFIDAKTWKPTKKYDGKVLTDGYTLVIQNLTKQDLNISYACVYGSSLGDPQYLLEENVFRSISSTEQTSPIDDIRTTQRNDQIENKTFSTEKIASIIFGVSTAVSVGLFIVCFWKRREKSHNHTIISIKDSNEEVPLINPFFGEPNDIQCIEGEDALLTCTLRRDITQVKWLKNDKEIIQNEKYIMSTADTEHTLTLMNTTEGDSGDYYVQVGTFSQKIQLNIAELPIEISRDERNTYMDAIKSGIENRQYVRIQVIGKYGVGKTSLVRRLLFLEDGEYDGTSTDGIEINRKCQIRRKDGKWFVSEVDTTKTEMIKRIQLAGSMEQSETVSQQTRQYLFEENVSEIETKQKGEQMPTTYTDYLFEIEKKQHDQEPPVSNEKAIDTDKLEIVIKSNMDATTINQDDKELRIADTKEKKNHDEFANPDRTDTHASHGMPADQITEMMNQKLDEIMSRAKTVKEKKESDDLVECGIWDFAGQKDYYATHQTFFTTHAIYLLVVDIEDNIKPRTHNEDDCYCIDDYIEFWFDSIHCFCNDHSASKLLPPVIMVCTGTDKFPETYDKEIYAEKLFANFGKDKKFNHNRGIYFISNTQFKDEDSTEIKILRQHISDIALEMGYFAETLPTKWIQLETALEAIKDVNIYVYSWEKMAILAKKYSLEEKELFLFLDYQHKIGNVIFFKEINEYIILQPNWLVKCFRCLVCDSHKGKRNYNLISPTAFNVLKDSGELSGILMNQLFQKEPELKFGDHQAYLLNIMEKFDIVIKPQFRDTSNDKCQKSDSYYLPCMIEKSSSYEDILDKFIPNSSDVSITPWLVFEFEFLPLAYFNHILFHYIRNYEVCKGKALYRGKAVFYLDELSKFIICFSHNAVSVQIWRWDVLEDNVYQTFLNEFCDNIEAIQGQLRHTISYSIKAKCSTGDYFNSEDRITLKDINERKRVYFCEEHRCTHSMDDIRNTWLKRFDRYFKKPGQKGLALIVNLMHLGTGAEYRFDKQVSGIDVKYLTNLFKEELKYKVECSTHGMPKLELQKYFRTIARTYLGENSKDYHSFICVIIGYGIENRIPTNDIDITFEDIKREFQNKPGGKFNGKPKVFLIQARQSGKPYDVQTEIQDESYNTSEDILDTYLKKSLPSENLKTEADIVEVWYSSEGVVPYFALPDGPEGSYFMSAFVSVVKNNFRDEHIEDILKIVITELLPNPKYASAFKRKGISNMPMIKFALTKKYFL